MADWRRHAVMGGILCVLAGVVGTAGHWLGTAEGQQLLYPGTLAPSDAAGCVMWCPSCTPGPKFVSTGQPCGTSGNPGGSDGQVQYNSGGLTFAGDAGMTYAPATDVLTVGGGVQTPRVVSAAAYGVVCNGSTDDTSALQAAIDALPQTGLLGGIVQLPCGTASTCILAGTVDLYKKKNITLRGCTGTGVGSVTTQLAYTGTDVRGFDARSAVNVDFERLRVTSNQASFNGSLIDYSHDGNDASYNDLREVYLAASNPGNTTATLVNFQKATNCSITDSRFEGGGVAVYGKPTAGSYSNVITIDRVDFRWHALAAIYNPGDSWTIQNSTFYPTRDGTGLHVIDHVTGSGVEGLLLANNWFGDGTTANAGQVWVKLMGDGLAIHGNHFEGDTDLKAIDFDGATSGVSLAGNDFDTFATGVDCTSHTTVANLAFLGNNFTSVADAVANCPVEGPGAGIEDGNIYFVSRASTNVYIDSDNSATTSAWSIFHNGTAGSGSPVGLWQVVEDKSMRLLNQMQVWFRELSANGTDAVVLQAPAALATSYALTLPQGTPIADNGCLKVYSNGQLYWAACNATPVPTATATVTPTPTVTATP